MTGKALPRYVAAALEQGFEITGWSVMLDCLLPASPKPLLRLFILAIEATLTFRFWALRRRREISVDKYACRWPDADLPWIGLCSQSALRESVTDLDVDEEVLAEK